MIQKVIFRQPAVEDVVEAAAWYEAHGLGLGEQLIDEILRATRRAQDNPELFRIVIATERFAACSQIAFPTASFSQSSGRRFMFMKFFTGHVMTAGGRNDCRRLLCRSCYFYFFVTE
jgi:hypothetical protein